MYELARNGFDSAAVFKMLRNNRTVTFEFQILNNKNVPQGMVTATGTIDFDASAKIKRVARLRVNDPREIDYLNSRVKPYMCLHVDKNILKFPLGVFLMNSPSKSFDGASVERVIECYDLTQILVDDKLAERMIIPAGANYVAVISSIIAGAGITNYRITPSDLSVAASIEFEIGTEKLDVINELLRSINYNELYCDATGVMVGSPYVHPAARTIESSYVTNQESVVLPESTRQLDVFSTPNKIVRYLESADRDVLISTAVNDNPLSQLSTISRGRVIVDVAKVDDIADQATLDAYTQRVLAESTLYERIIFSSANIPNHEFLDCLYLSNKDLGISGTYIETAWKMELKTGGVMEHVCRKAVGL